MCVQAFRLAMLTKSTIDSIAWKVQKVKKIKGSQTLFTTIFTVLKLGQAMYTDYIYDLIDSIEHEIKFKGRYGAKGEKRGPRKKATPEQMARQNQWKKEALVRRKIKANFSPGDLWQTMKYPAGTRATYQQVKDDLKQYHRAMRKIYKARGQPYKWISRIEIGSHGGIHVHLIANRLNDPRADLIAQEEWEKITRGRINYTNLYAEGGYAKLAKYITKPPNEQQREILKDYEPNEVKGLVKYSSSRNLVTPEPVKKAFKRRTLRKMIIEGIKAAEGYYVDPESVYYGINPYNGMTYLRYTECRIGTLNGTPEPVKPSMSEWEDGG